MLNRREDILAISCLNPFDRVSDGRPRVPDDLLESMYEVTV